MHADENREKGQHITQHTTKKRYDEMIIIIIIYIYYHYYYGYIIRHHHNIGVVISWSYHIHTYTINISSVLLYYFLLLMIIYYYKCIMCYYVLLCRIKIIMHIIYIIGVSDNTTTNNCVILCIVLPQVDNTHIT